MFSKQCELVVNLTSTQGMHGTSESHRSVRVHVQIEWLPGGPIPSIHYDSAPNQ